MSTIPSAAGTILVADDDPQVRGLIVRLLRRAGFACVEAADGAEAVRIAQDIRPDLVLLDILMPGLNGTDALAKLREHFATRFTPVIYVTGNAVADVTHLLAGADDYVTKPFEPDELVARVKVALRRVAELRSMNALTGLPGTDLILAEADQRLAGGDPFAFLYVDLDQFKGFNDAYGFAVGDQALRMLDEVISDVIDAYPSPANFIGHIGGDDFVVMTEPALLEAISYEIILRLETAAARIDPRKPPRRLSVSIGALVVDSERFSSGLEVSTAAARAKKAAKRVCGSHLAIDDNQPKETV